MAVNCSQTTGGNDPDVFMFTAVTAAYPERLLISIIDIKTCKTFYQDGSRCLGHDVGCHPLYRITQNDPLLSLTCSLFVNLIGQISCSLPPLTKTKTICSLSLYQTILKL